MEATTEEGIAVSLQLSGAEISGVSEYKQLVPTVIIPRRVSPVFSTTIFSNLDECRTECEISADRSVVVVIYEARDGWHIKRLRIVTADERQDFDDGAAEAKEGLSGCVNRFGEDVPEGLTRASLSLWLMQKRDGTAMGIQTLRVPGE
jgi:hypothetical protein